MSHPLTKAFAKFDPAHLFDGLFVPTSGRKRGRLYVPLKTFGDSQIGFQGFEQLGADDQSVLLAISAQLGIDGLTIEHDTAHAISKELRVKINLSDGDTRKIATKQTSLRSILYDAGYETEGGSTFKRIKESLNRLANAQIREISASGWDRRCNLLSSHFNHETGDVYISVNPRLTEAVFYGQHVKISLFERNKLKKEVSKILHAWLCSNVRLGQKLGRNGVKIDNLIPHVYGLERTQAMSVKQRSNARIQIREALTEIKVQASWGVQISRNIALINRPKEIPLIEKLFPHGQGIVTFE